jgi:two-component system sensor histidine kinase DctS
MSLRRLPIHWKITLLSFGILLYSLFLAGILHLSGLVNVKETESGQRSMITARTVAGLPEIKKWVVHPEGAEMINPMVERIRIIHGVDYIVVLNMNKERMSYPIAERIGTRFAGGDEAPAFAEHIYLSKAKGELGYAMRAFVPIMNDDLQQIGVVVTGKIMPSLFQILLDIRKEVYLTIILSLLFGFWGSWLLARHIKKQMFDLEPYQIARMLMERIATFDAIHEGVIAIDSKERITIFNDSAKKILGIDGEPIGERIQEVVPNSRLSEVLKEEHPIYNREFQIGHTLVMSSRIPIKLKGKTIGAVAIFLDRTEIKQMAEELTGVKAFIDALRVQSHEHMNKLHTIAGLIQLGHDTNALDYIYEVSEEQAELTHFLGQRIHDHSLSGLLLGKVGRGKELGIKVTIDRNSRFLHFPKNLDPHDVVVVVGNLIENAFDSLQHIERDKKEVFISIDQNNEAFSILVEDNGCGIDEHTQRHMLQYGFSTKGEEGRGIGLHLVQKVVEKGNGEIHVQSSPNVGTTFLVTFPIEDREENKDG